MERSKKSEIFTLAVIVLAIAASLTAWGRLAWTGTTDVSAARFLKNKDAATDRRQIVSCRGNAVYYNQAIWQFPCEYKKYLKSDSDREFDIISGFNRWDIENQTNELSWQVPELSEEDGGYKKTASDYVLFAFAPRRDKPEQIAVGLQPKFRKTNFRAEELYFYVLQATQNGDAKKFGADLPVERSQVSGVDWNGDELEIVVRTENGAARIYSSSGEGDWKVRDVADKDCGENQKCRLEVAFYEQNRWQLVFSRIPNNSPENIDDVNVEFWQGAEDGNLSKFTELSIKQLGNRYFTDKPKNVWFDESFDASSGNVLARGLSRRPFRRVNKEWKQLELPPESDGSAADLRFDVYQSAGYFHDGENLSWFPAGKYLGKDERDHDKEWIFYKDRWLTGADTARSFFDLSERAIKIRDVRRGEEKSIVGVNRGWWFHEYNADTMPLPNGELLIFNSYNDYVRLNSDLERVDKLSSVERFDRMIGENFRLFGAGSHAGYIYNRNYKFLKQASVPLMLFAFPLFLLAGVLYRRIRKQSDDSFRIRDTVRVAALGYLAICLIFGYYFWILTGFF